MWRNLRAAYYKCCNTGDLQLTARTTFNFLTYSFFSAGTSCLRIPQKRSVYLLVCLLHLVLVLHSLSPKERRNRSVTRLVSPPRMLSISSAALSNMRTQAPGIYRHSYHLAWGKRSVWRREYTEGLFDWISTIAMLFDNVLPRLGSCTLGEHVSTLVSQSPARGRDEWHLTLLPTSRSEFSWTRRLYWLAGIPSMWRSFILQRTRIINRKLA